MVEHLFEVVRLTSLRRIFIDGTSMNRAGLHDGMQVWVRPCDAADHGAVVVVRQADGSLTVKRYYQGRPVPGFSGSWLLPDSTDARWEPRPMWGDDCIVGVVVGLPHRDLSGLLEPPLVVRASDLPPRQAPLQGAVSFPPTGMVRGDTTPDYEERCERDRALSEWRHGLREDG